MIQISSGASREITLKVFLALLWRERIEGEGGFGEAVALTLALSHEWERE